MKALVKRERAAGCGWRKSRPEDRHQRRADQGVRTGICGTDVHIYNWDAWAQKTIPGADGHRPRVCGRDRGGRLERGRLPAGDIVSGEGHVVCGRCRNCLAGRRHLCKDTKGIGVNRPGAFAEYMALPMTNVWLHDPAHHRDVAAIFDPFGNAVHTALSFPVLGEDVLITGAGPIGAMAAAVVRHAGARYVVITDVNPYRLELAGRLGATLAVDVRTTQLADVQKQLGMKEGFDVGLEMSGNPAAFRDMLQNMCHGGKIAMLGIPTEDIAIDWKPWSSTC